MPLILGEGLRTEEAQAGAEEMYEQHGLAGTTLLVEQLALGNLMHLLDNRAPAAGLDEAAKEDTKAEILAIIDAKEQAIMAAEQALMDRDDRHQ